MFQVHTHHYVTYRGVIFAPIVLGIVTCNPCDILRNDVTYKFQVIQYASIEVEISAEIYNNRYWR